MSRLYINDTKKQIIVLSYAGGTKYFRHLTETQLTTYIACDGNTLNTYQQEYDAIQIVRDPVDRYLSWFDKQYIKPLWLSKFSDTSSFDSWAYTYITKSWIDDYFAKAKVDLHYDGHTNFQSCWPKASLGLLYNNKGTWSYLKMEDIDPYFLNTNKFDLAKTPGQYIGISEALNPATYNYLIKNITQAYAYDIEWYANLDFICPK